MKYKNNQTGFSHPIILVVILVALIVGAGLYVKNHQSKSLSSEDITSQSELIDELPANLLTIEKLKNLADAEKPGSNIASIKLEKDGEVLVYIVRLTDGTKLIYNAQSGVKITGAKVEVDEDGDDLPVNFTTTIGLSKAYELALAQNPGGKLKEVELESEHGIVVYKFEFSNGTKIEIGATNGGVVRVKKESNNDKEDHKNKGSSRERDGDRDDDGTENNQDSDDDDDGQKDDGDSDDDNDGTDDDEDSDDDEDDVDDEDDSDEDEPEEDESNED